ncbi:MAG TPA: methionine--tRNA ligase [Actinomycetota bacterium]|nr:methionine--tRNA ligase [Actinomycetota bacterium]
MGRDVFYLTTPIYYPNDVPHIGHAYDAVAADVIARFHRLRGEEVFHLTGTDEHGLKLQRAAEAAGMDPERWVDEMEPRWREVWERLDIGYDDYIRTTEPRHRDAVVKLLDQVHHNGREDIYLATYEGRYCVSCELYYTESDLLEGGLCPVHERPVELMKEENYFFRLSAYADRLLEHYERTPTAVEPESRRNEVLSLIRGGLQDFSISRTSFDWGIPLPWDPAHVCYVWFDALTNYITAAGFGTDEARFRRIWPANIHMIGKDILRQHAIYWPAMLMAAGIEPPTQVWAHGYLTVGGKKMSKTNLTGIHPFELVDRFGVDSYRWYFLREVQFGQDGSFSYESMVDRHNAELANGIGNLASRVLAMLAASFDGAVPENVGGGLASDLPDVVAEAARRFEDEMLAVRPTAGLSAVYDVVARANRYMVERSPWTLAKDPAERDRLSGILYASVEVLRALTILISPVMPSAAARLWEQLGIPEPLGDQRLEDASRWGVIAPGTRTTKGPGLFPRVEAEP